MTRMLSVRAALFCAVLFSSVTLESRELPSRASFARFSGVGEVVIAATRDEDALREAVEKRLQQAGITIDPSLPTRLVVTVYPARNTAPSGLKHFFYFIQLAFQEPVRSERFPDRVFRATTWSQYSHVSRFEEDVSAQALVDSVEARVEDFLVTVSTDTRGAKGNSINR